MRYGTVATALLMTLLACAPAAVAPPDVSVTTSPRSDAGVGATPSGGAAAVVPAANWPNPDPNPPAISCAYRYPDDLQDRANAFDATVVDVDLGKYSEDAGARPATLTVSLNEVFKGPQKSSVVMKTWDFSLPPRPERVVGVRILAAAGEALDLMSCGFTRPYSQSDADRWRELFARAANARG